MAINQKLHYTMYYYLLTTVVRDSFEYVLVDKKEYDVNAYNVRKMIIGNAIKDNSQFINFCNQNDKVGETLKKQANDLYELVYQDQNRFIRIENNNLVIDHSLNTKVLDLIVPLHFSLKNICLAHYSHLEEEYKDSRYEQLVLIESKYFSVISSFVFAKLIFVDRFKAFNESMKANQGNENIESNFIVSEMSKLASIHNWIKANEGKDVEEFNEAEKFMQHGFDMSSGTIKPDNGKTIFQHLDEDIKGINDVLAKIEPTYHKMHNSLWKELSEYEASLNKKLN